MEKVVKKDIRKRRKRRRKREKRKKVKLMPRLKQQATKQINPLQNQNQKVQQYQL